MKINNDKKYIAVDLGAESGRVILGTVEENRLKLDQVHRFDNVPVNENGSFRWDFNKLLSDIKTGIKKAVLQADGEVSGIGIDSWGVDFGLIGADGKLLENPYHYRDSRTDTMMEKAFGLMSKRQIYDHTGLQFLQFNSVYQLLAMRLANSQVLVKAKTLIFMADLFSYYLCGKLYAEYSLASTSQFMDMKNGKWSKPVLEKLGLSEYILPQVIMPGTIVGRLTEEVAGQLGCGQIPVIAIGSHDTASAVVAIPADEKTKWAYLSSGTWSLMGVEVHQAIINDKTFKYEFTNEGGVEHTIRLLKNIMGLWLVQECKRQWQKEVSDLSYDQLINMAAKAKPFVAYIDPDYNGFFAPGDMPKRINDYLHEKGHSPVNDKGQMIRIILESLALKYRHTMEKIEDVTGSTIDVLHIVGGGIQNRLLCQFTTNAIGKKVVTGPVEGTAIGNILMQATATGQIMSLSHARAILRNSVELEEYQPMDTIKWQQQYMKITGA
jgi:rhamnulokinase